MTAFTVSGPGIDKRFTDPGSALSRAITAATAAREPSTFYVRDAAGEPVGYAEREEDGRITVKRR